MYLQASDLPTMYFCNAFSAADFMRCWKFFKIEISCFVLKNWYIVVKFGKDHNAGRPLNRPLESSLIDWTNLETSFKLNWAKEVTCNRCQRVQKLNWSKGETLRLFYTPGRRLLKPSFLSGKCMHLMRIFTLDYHHSEILVTPIYTATALILGVRGRCK